MKFNVYSIRNNLANELGPLFTAKNDDVAKRLVIDNISSKAFRDCSLVSVGVFNTEKGITGSKVYTVHLDDKLLKEEI